MGSSLTLALFEDKNFVKQTNEYFQAEGPLPIRDLKIDLLSGARAATICSRH